MPSPIKEAEKESCGAGAEIAPGLFACAKDRVLLALRASPEESCREEALGCIAERNAIHEVRLAGEEPLLLGDASLEGLLSRLRNIPHVELLRIETRVPIALPRRITPALARMLRRFDPLWLEISCLHPEELTAGAAQACARLADAGIPLCGRILLVPGLNDSPELMGELLRELLRLRVRPALLVQTEPGPEGTRRGLEILRALRGRASGYAIPHFLAETPEGRLPLLPDYVKARDGQYLVLENFEGGTFRYPDPGPDAAG